MSFKAPPQFLQIPPTHPNFPEKYLQIVIKKALNTFHKNVPRSSSRGPSKSQKEGQEDQGEIKSLGGPTLTVLRSPGSSGLPSGSSLGSLELPQGNCSKNSPSAPELQTTLHPNSNTGQQGSVKACQEEPEGAPRGLPRVSQGVPGRSQGLPGGSPRGFNRPLRSL